MSNIKGSKLGERLREKLDKTGISAHALEKQAGLKRSAVQNIIHGKSKKPSADILLAITKVLGCSVQDLLEPPILVASTPTSVVKSSPISEEVFNAKLYAQAATLASDLFNHRHIRPTTKQALEFIDEVYQYSIKSAKTDIDHYFTQWLFDKYFKQ